jgi:hypothetical protein
MSEYFVFADVAVVATTADKIATGKYCIRISRPRE